LPNPLDAQTSDGDLHDQQDPSYLVKRPGVAEVFVEQDRMQKEPWIGPPTEAGETSNPEIETLRQRLIQAEIDRDIARYELLFWKGTGEMKMPRPRPEQSLP
jgi:hypothetical protein